MRKILFIVLVMVLATMLEPPTLVFGQTGLTALVTSTGIPTGIPFTPAFEATSLLWLEPMTADVTVTQFKSNAAVAPSATAPTLRPVWALTALTIGNTLTGWTGEVSHNVILPVNGNSIKTASNAETAMTMTMP
jgi:hypothetical protein